MSKEALGTVSLRPKMMDMYPHPLGTYDSLRKIFVKMGAFPQMRTLVDCACWVHILARAPGDERHPYRVLISDSIDFQPYTIVSKSGHVCEDP